MKTRLLALVLACLMVLSVMPVVVFAEDFCELSSQVDGDHTLATCPDGEYIKTVPPQCGDRWGYDLFKCPGCSEFFADNFVAPIKDAHALELVEKGTAATCKTEGVSAKYECMNMHVDANGNPIKCDYTEGGEVLPKLEHDWQRTGSETGDCESDSLISFKCSLCGETKTEGSKNEHSWITPPTIEMESQLDANGNLVAIGWGTYTCSRCPATKKVIVLHDCNLKKVDAKAATCVENGNIEYWICQHPDCAKRFATNDAAGTVLTDADIIVTAGAHKLTKVEAVAATCDKATQTVILGNIEYYHCELCGKNFADENATTELTDDQIVAGDHAWREEGYVAPTCDKWGGTRYICGNCGAIKNNDPEEPRGHTSYDDATSTNKSGVINFTCQGGGERTWKCGRCGEAQKEAVAKHELKKAEFAATCTNFAYSFSYCTVCDASNQVATETYKDVVYDLSVPVLDANGDYTYDAQGNMIRTLYVVVGKVTYGDTVDPENHNWIIRDTNAPTCEEGWKLNAKGETVWVGDGDKVWYCEDCSNIFKTEVVPGYHRVPQGEGVLTPATCTTDAYTTYLCAECGHNYTIVDEGSKTGHSELVFDYTVAPTCKAQGYDVYKCTNEGCTHTENRNYASKVEYILGTFYTKIEGDNTYATLDAYKDIFVGYFKDVHVNATLDEENGIHIQGNCNRLGLYRYYCPDCETYILVAMPGTGLGHQNDGVYDKDGEVAPVEATCTTDGSKGTYKCTECGEMVSINPTNLTKLGHSLTKVTNVPAEKCDIGYWTCSTCKKMFSDAEGKTEVSGFADHATEVVDFRLLTCEDFQYIHNACKNCGLEYINSYIVAPGHNWSKTEGKAPTCIEDGVEDLWVCDRELIGLNENGFYVYTCGCEHSENNGEVIPATGIHKNSDGREFTDKCTDTETNRVCVVCKDYIERKHHYADPIYVDATCVDYGYNLYICVDCLDDKMEKVAEKTDHNWGAWTPVEGNPNMEERFCQTERCTAREERKIADVEYFVEIENVLGNVGYTDSSRIAVTVKIKADSPLWGVRFDLNYDENLTFDGYEFISDKLDCGRDLHDNGGFIRIAADASNTDDKQKTDVVLEGKEALVVVYFRITLPLDPTTKLPVVGHEKTESVLSITPIDAINVKDEDLKAVFCGDVVNNAYTDTAKIEILPFMNFNLDCCVNMKDLSEMYDLVLAAEGSDDYDVTLDIDQNGVIEAIDYAYLYRYLVNAKSYEDMTKIGVPADTLA